MKKFKTAYCESVSDKVDYSDEVSLTSQEFRSDCDINSLLKRMTLDDVTRLHTRTVRNPLFNDNFGKYEDYQSLLDKVNDANEIFASLSSDEREKYQNDPSLYFEFLQSENAKYLDVDDKTGEKIDEKTGEKTGEKIDEKSESKT